MAIAAAAAGVAVVRAEVARVAVVKGAAKAAAVGWRRRWRR